MATAQRTRGLVVFPIVMATHGRARYNPRLSDLRR